MKSTSMRWWTPPDDDDPHQIWERKDMPSGHRGQVYRENGEWHALIEATDTSEHRMFASLPESWEWVDQWVRHKTLRGGDDE